MSSARLIAQPSIRVRRDTPLRIVVRAIRSWFTTPEFVQWCTNIPKEKTMKIYEKPKATPIRLPAALGAEASVGGGGGWGGAA